MSHNQQYLNWKCLKTENFVTDNVFFDKSRKCLTTNTVSTASVGTDSVFLLKMSCNRQCLFTTYLILSLLTLSCNRNYLVLDFHTQRKVSARPKLFWPTMRKNCSSDWEKLLKFEAEGKEFSKSLRSLEQFIQTLKVRTILIQIGKKYWELEICKKGKKKLFLWKIKPSGLKSKICKFIKFVKSSCENYISHVLCSDWWCTNQSLFLQAFLQTWLEY